MLPRRKSANVTIGIALSLLLHGLAVLWWWNMTPPGAVLTAHVLHTLQVRLMRELPPAQPPALASEIAQSKNQPQATARPLRTAPSTHAATPTTPPPTAAASASSASPVAAEKHLDLAAVHASLAAIVAEDDRERGETPVGQLHAKPLYQPDDDNQVAKAIRNTTRPDCKNNIANTGLLAPLFLLAMAADKKDSGCKW
jgi:hypothetical protein